MKICNKCKQEKEYIVTIRYNSNSNHPKDWDLDSYIKFEPIKNNYIVNYKGEDRVLLSVNIYIISGLHFTLSGKIGVSVYETIPTDYDFKCKYEEGQFFVEELRNWKINNVLD
jgi:hypothetical protein